MKDFSSREIEYLTLLAQRYPNIEAVSEEIINLSAILKLPKGTEHYISDIHGESQALDLVLRNGSGVIKRKINDIFQDRLTQQEKDTLATLIYYPEDKLSFLESKDKDFSSRDWDNFYQKTLDQLLEMTRVLSAKYTRSKVRKMLPKHFAYIVEELLQERDIASKKDYYHSLLKTILENKRAKAFVVALAYLIQRLAVDHLHVVGDIYDRGSGAHLIMDKLMSYHSLDIQWGNHDIIWMGAAAGSLVCLAIVLRISLRYKNLETLEDGYGISLLPLAIFAMQTYGVPPETFGGGKSSERDFSEWEKELYAKMEKAIAIMQFKLEGQIIRRHPEYHMEDRRFLETIDFEKATVCIGGKTYSLIDKDFPTLKQEDPYALSKEEETVLICLARNIQNSVKLQSHAKFLFDKGSMYLVYNEQVLFHGCVPFTSEGEFASFVDEQGRRYAGKSLLDYFHTVVQDCYPPRPRQEETQQRSLDTLWYLWCGKLSPLFGKERMTTFERYFIQDKESHKEGKNSYFSLREHEHVAYSLIREFGADPERAHIVNGHVPVKANKGERPVKAGGKVITIDGGFSRAYQKITGIAGYTLIYNSYGLLLATHNSFCYGDTIGANEDMQTDTQILESQKGRVLIESSDVGRKLAKDVENLRLLLTAYMSGLIEENRDIT